MTIEAGKDIKVALTAQLYELSYMLKYNKTREGNPPISPDSGYTQAGVALRELALYDDWDGSLLGPALGGFESKQALLRGFTAVRDGFKAKIGSTPHPVTRKTQSAVEIVAIADRATAKTNISAIGAKTCEENPEQAAMDKYGVFMGKLPGAQLMACHQKKVIIVGSIVALLVVLAILGPYVNLIGNVVRK